MESLFINLNSRDLGKWRIANIALFIIDNIVSILYSFFGETSNLVEMWGNLVVEFRLHSALNVMLDDPGEKLEYEAVMKSLLMKSVTSKLVAAV